VIILNSRFHLWTSILKSVVRMTGCVWLISSGDYMAFAWAFIFAELLGVAEELGDDR